MKEFGRRIFAKSAPMVATAGVSALGTTPNQTGPAPVNYGYGAEKAGMDVSAKVDEYARPRKLFDELLRKERDPTVYRQRVKQWQLMSPNIKSLRSMSEQHKLHMMFAHEDETKAAKETWIEKLANSVGFPLHYAKDRLW